MHSIVPIIMAGGSGTRLWPLSRALYPKQFLALTGHETLFQLAVQRLMVLPDADISTAPPCVVCNEEHRFLVADQLREVGASLASIVLEPVGRNTAPAMTLAALWSQTSGADPVLVVVPADQIVTAPQEFIAAMRRAIHAAADGGIVVLGVVPERPETGYGYIRAEGDACAEGSIAVARFVEKPVLAVAADYVASGEYFWNSGMFVVRASVWLQALEHLRPDIATATRAAWDARSADQAFLRPGKVEFAAVPSESIDYAVIEKCAAAGSRFSVRMVTLAAGWSDLGGWDTVWQASERDTYGNATHGDVLLEASTNSLVHATSRLVAGVGVEDLIIVETADAVLVTRRSRSQDVKAIVARLTKEQRSECSLHRRVHRPWGWYDGIDHGARFQVKRIMVKPGASLSLQMHHHRAEHWVVVSGTAEVTCGEKKMLLTENQSTYIPLGEVHRLANPGRIPLEIIEVQSGSYLGEDDIVRLQDTYGRLS
jgi:mannose-1-phosphate guanylyltransferase/mannose-6-phosphate isomerase